MEQGPIHSCAVMTATNRNAQLLGGGGFGSVYDGRLASGQEVAVKVAAKGSNQGSKEFINEVGSTRCFPEVASGS